MGAGSTRMSATPLAILIKRHGKKSPRLIKLEIDEKGNITTDTKKLQRMIRICFKNQYSTKLENINEMDKFIDI